MPMLLVTLSQITVVCSRMLNLSPCVVHEDSSQKACTSISTHLGAGPQKVNKWENEKTKSMTLRHQSQEFLLKHDYSCFHVA